MSGGEGGATKKCVIELLSSSSDEEVVPVKKTRNRAQVVVTCKMNTSSAQEVISMLSSDDDSKDEDARKPAAKPISKIKSRGNGTRKRCAPVVTLLENDDDSSESSWELDAAPTFQSKNNITIPSLLNDNKKFKVGVGNEDRDCKVPALAKSTVAASPTVDMEDGDDDDVIECVSPPCTTSLRKEYSRPTNLYSVSANGHGRARPKDDGSDDNDDEAQMLSPFGPTKSYNHASEPCSREYSTPTNNYVNRNSNNHNDNGTQQHTPMRVPLISEIGGKLYPDLKHHFIQALLKYAKNQRHAAAQRFALDSSVRAAVVLALYPYPIRTPESAAKSIKGIGSGFYEILKNSATSVKRSAPPYVPPRRKFSSVAAAALVALYDNVNQNPSDPLCSLEELITLLNSKVDLYALNKPIDYYLDKDFIDVGWKQIEKLCKPNVLAGVPQLVKQRRNKNKSASGLVYELLPEGKVRAAKLHQSLLDGPTMPGPLRQLAADSVASEFDDITMCVDFREGGGGGNSLHKFCDLLDDNGVPYFVRELKVSDYIFFIGNKLAPMLIERKKIDDVAASLADGRWEKQQQKMRQAQYILGGGEQRKCQISYLIEGDASKHTVHGGNVGRRSWDQSVEDVENAIARLPALGFSVMRSVGPGETMRKLAEVAKDVVWKYKNGSIDCTYTYEAFMRSLSGCDDRLGDRPTDAIHQNPAPPIPNNVPQRRQRPNGGTPGSAEQHNPLRSEKEQKLKKLTKKELENMCVDSGEAKSGSKSQLVERLLKPRKPEILLTRLRRRQYVPKIPSCNAALCVALLIHDKPGLSDGLTKENLMLYADETGVSRDPMAGNGGFYDGWYVICHIFHKTFIRCIFYCMMHDHLPIWLT